MIIIDHFMNREKQKHTLCRPRVLSRPGSTIYTQRGLWVQAGTRGISPHKHTQARTHTQPCVQCVAYKALCCFLDPDAKVKVSFRRIWSTRHLWMDPSDSVWQGKRLSSPVPALFKFNTNPTLTLLLSKQCLKGNKERNLYCIHFFSK